MKMITLAKILVALGTLTLIATLYSTHLDAESPDPVSWVTKGLLLLTAAFYFLAVGVLPVYKDSKTTLEETIEDLKKDVKEWFDDK